MTCANNHLLSNAKSEDYLVLLFIVTTQPTTALLDSYRDYINFPKISVNSDMPIAIVYGTSEYFRQRELNSEPEIAKRELLKSLSASPKYTNPTAWQTGVQLLF